MKIKGSQNKTQQCPLIRVLPGGQIIRRRWAWKRRFQRRHKGFCKVFKHHDKINSFIVVFLGSGLWKYIRCIIEILAYYWEFRFFLAELTRNVQAVQQRGEGSRNRGRKSCSLHILACCWASVCHCGVYVQCLMCFSKQNRAVRHFLKTTTIPTRSSENAEREWLRKILEDGVVADQR